MPRYIMSVDIPAGTPQSSPAKDTVTVKHKVAVEGFIFIDQGAKDTVRAEVRFGERRIHPHPNSEPQRVPGITNTAVINVELPGVPNELRLRGWAPNSNNEHDAIAVLDMRKPENVAQDVRVVGAGRGARDPAPTPTPEDIMSAGENG